MTMKKKVHLPVQQIIIACSYCNQQYQTISTSTKNISISSCSNCNPFYTGTLASEVNVGAVEKYRQRAKKVKNKN
ncbi:MAG: 50S ribosomal protein L31 [Candidatus Moeniiplasma glomeromycotorum]|nr:50S ribosomal protein L31 [Candidatus Moeniiplasma glomeromycotorum]MCE8169937.1 50S ribosomal protein L31 [Candidatus Moeniiplasma glomeromycotorum]